MKHSPGPWTVGGNYAHKTVLKNANGESIASGGNNRAVVGEELEASLILAAAAPRMAKALQRAAHIFAELPDQSPQMLALRNEIVECIKQATPEHYGIEAGNAA